MNVHDSSQTAQKPSNSKGTFYSDWFAKVAKITAFILFICSIGIMIFHIFRKDTSLTYTCICYLPKSDNSTITESVSISYICGYVVFLLTSYFPERKRKSFYTNIAILETKAVYYRALLSLFQMYKNVCTEKQWKSECVTALDDQSCFTGNFYTRMQRFDVTAFAESVKINEKTGKPFRWIDQMTFEANHIHQMLSETLQTCGNNLSADFITTIDNLRKCFYIEYLSGNFTNINQKQRDKEGYIYFDYLPVESYYNQKSAVQFSGFFQGENIENLRMYIRALIDLQCVINRYSKQKITKKFCISKLSEEKTGHFETAIMKTT